MTNPGSANDPLWFKDAIIYELHVRAFFDSNNDGIGDFPGLTEKLDYLQDLGVTCLWLLPFFPFAAAGRRLRHLRLHRASIRCTARWRTFEAFLDAAHERGLQVMIELVMNHTSDQHPWFQAARQAPPGSPERDFYVWSDTDQIYRDARIIFTDTEKSNWTWDPVAQGVLLAPVLLASAGSELRQSPGDGRDAEGHALLAGHGSGRPAAGRDSVPGGARRNQLREPARDARADQADCAREIDAEYANRMILAEANQWPADVRPYFGDGDECHMAFHFPLMPRIYMALRQEDRLPITDIMAQTPAIPETCQWGLFLRNHDELTLEMVTDDERDYMYLAYSADPRMRINLGIRRRLAPLVDNNRRRIELLNSLLFSFPGTPDPLLRRRDRHGRQHLPGRPQRRAHADAMERRTATPASREPIRRGSIVPVIMDPVYGYEAINVEAQQSDPSSLLNWMRNMIALRKLFQVFGRGTLEFLNPSNRKVLAYLRRYRG